MDIASELVPAGIEAICPRCGPSYAELTIPRRQRITGGEDVLLASHYCGCPLYPGADEVWNRLAAGGSEWFRLVRWKDPQEL